jgi:hypothetical protein
MIIAYWNSDGFGDIAKYRFVKDTIREYKADFFAILETGISNFSTPFLNNLSGGRDFQWYCVPPLGRSGAFWWVSMLTPFQCKMWLWVRGVLNFMPCLDATISNRLL